MHLGSKEIYILLLGVEDVAETDEFGTEGGTEKGGGIVSDEEGRRKTRTERDEGYA